MASASISDTAVKPDDKFILGNPDRDKDKPVSNPEKTQKPPRSVPRRSETIWIEGARGQEYPQDRPGEAAGENGRVWKIYRDRVKEIDEDLLEGWNDTLNMLLVFAGLFSAVCTAFLIEVTKNLQPDWQRATSLAVFAIYVHLNSTGPAPFEIPNPTLPFVADTDARYINGLWFASLTLSLTVSLLAILAKQWLNEFKSRMRAPASSPKMWAMRHSAFKGGLERWGMDAFISTLPILLHAALGFFMAGLWLFLLPLDSHIAAGVIVAAAVVGVFYVIACLAPLVWGDCPSATPMLRYLYSFWSRLISQVIRMTVWTILVLFTFFVLPILLFLVFVCLIFDFILYILGKRRIVELSNELPISSLFWDAVGSPIFDFTTKKLPRAAGLRADHFPVLPSSLIRAPRPIYTPSRYRLIKTPPPAFDQIKILDLSYEPLREASALAWMIRTLPSEHDIQAALCATGWLSASAHFDYFRGRRQDSPLVHVDLCRAAVDALGSLATQPDPVDDLMLTSILRAYFFVAQGPLKVANATKEFLSGYRQRNEREDVHDLGLLSQSVLTSGGGLPPSAALQLVNIQARPVELIALSGSRGHPCLHIMTRVALYALKNPTKPYAADLVSILEADIASDDRCRKAGWKPCKTDNLTLRLISAMDVGLTNVDVSKTSEWERRVIANVFAAAARDIVTDSAVSLARDLHKRLHWITSKNFRRYEFSATDVDSLARLLLRVSPDGRCISPAALLNLLGQLGRTVLPLSPETISWIVTAFALPSVSREMVQGLQQYRTAEAALLHSHMSLLKPIVISKKLSASPWSLLLSITTLPSNAEELGKLADGYTVLLLVLQRRGYGATAQALLRELLPHEWATRLISSDTGRRRHIAQHAKTISQAWWTKLSRVLIDAEPAQAWVPCTEFADANSFVTAVSSDADCTSCTHDDIPLRWGTAPMSPDGSAQESELTVNDAATWNPLDPAAAGAKAPWHAPFVRFGMRVLRMPAPASMTGNAVHGGTAV